MMQRNLFSFLCILLVLGCAKGNSSGEAMLRFGDYVPLKGTRGCKDSLFLGHPQDIRFFNGWLLMYDPYDGQTFTAVHPETWEQKRLLNVGTGAGEVILPVNLFQTEHQDTIVMYERSTKLFKHMAWTDFISGNLQPAVCSMQLTEPCYNAVLCKDGYVMNVSHEGKQFRWVDAKHHAITEFGKYLGKVDGWLDDFSAGMVTQCRMVCSPCENYFVTTGYMSDWLLFYKIEGNQFLLSKEYFSIEADLDVYKHHSGYTSRRNERTLQTYVDLCPTREYVYALYQGCRIKETPKKDVSYLQVLDWEGNFKIGFRFDKRLFSITVDEASKTLYALAGGEESCIYVYKLVL